jgi:hypothetical protein
MEQELATPMGFPKQKAQWGTEFELGLYVVHDLLGSAFCLFLFMLPCQSIWYLSYFQLIFRFCLELDSMLRAFRFLSFSRSRNYALEGIVIFLMRIDFAYSNFHTNFPYLQSH